MTRYPPAAPAEIRQAWQQRDATGPAGLRIAVLSSFTADPLLPYLGLPLHTWGLAPQFAVGPFNQIAQQCMDQDSETARFAPHVLVVAARPEDRPAAGDTEERFALRRLATLARDTARRWGALLVWVLPPLPQDRPHGVGDHGDPDGAAAHAVAEREWVRRTLADQADACVVDADEAVRAVGTRAAYHPALFAFARIPFTEEVFALLGEEIARVVGARHGRGCQGVLVDVDGLLLDAADPSDGEAATALAELLEQLPARRPVAYRTRRPRPTAWRLLAERAPRFVRLPATWIADGRTQAAQLGSFAAGLGVCQSTIAVLTGETSQVDDWPDDSRVIRCGPHRDPARRGLVAAGAFDLVLPVAEHTAVDRFTPEDRVSPSLKGTTGGLDDFLRGLQVSASLSAVEADTAPDESEVAERAHDFTLALEHPPADYLAAADRSLLSARVSDRYGDYGVSAVIGLRDTTPACVVELFSLSCVVMGKGVEDLLLTELVDRAAQRGADVLEFRYRDTGRNRPAVDFLHGAQGPRHSRDGRVVQICAHPAP